MENMILDRTIRANANFLVDPLLGSVLSAVYDWVPVDPADVRKMMLKEKMDLVVTKYYLEYFRDGWEQYRVKLAMGRDLQLNPSQYGTALNTFGYPYTRIGSKTLDWHDSETFKYSLLSVSKKNNRMHSFCEMLVKNRLHIMMQKIIF
ncbi:MAG: hypothetical protein U9P36_01275 [Thermodesulfobacteriota bacterium]|nr:hypothetical protein [Thermodesulfobacteriota bacterium]